MGDDRDMQRYSTNQYDSRGRDSFDERASFADTDRRSASYDEQDLRNDRGRERWDDDGDYDRRQENRHRNQRRQRRYDDYDDDGGYGGGGGGGFLSGMGQTNTMLILGG